MSNLTIENWLKTRLSAGNQTPREITDAALSAGFELADLLRARKLLQITASTDPSGKTVWSLPPVLSLVEQRPEPRIMRADQLPTPHAGAPQKDAGAAKAGVKRRDPAEQVRIAQNIIKRRAPTAARYLRELAEKASQDAKPCPACGRGLPRDEELRLKAVNGLLDRAGLSAAKAGTVGDDAGGPLIVFPPGTRIAILAQTPAEPESEAVERPVPPEMRVTRADLFNLPEQMAQKAPIVPQEERS